MLISCHIEEYMQMKIVRIYTHDWFTVYILIFKNVIIKCSIQLTANNVYVFKIRRWLLLTFTHQKRHNHWQTKRLNNKVWSGSDHSIYRNVHKNILTGVDDIGVVIKIDQVLTALSSHT